MLEFRALQSLMDLRATVGRQPLAGIKGISAHIPPADRERGAGKKALARVILHQGGRLERTEDKLLTDALMLAATQPDSDPVAFASATAILLADRIQLGLGKDDLSPLWEGFQTDYLALDPHCRAAIVHGFLTAERLGSVQLSPSFTATAHLTVPRERVTAGLYALASQSGHALVAAATKDMDAITSALAATQLRAALAGSVRDPLTGDAPLFDPLLALACDPAHPAFLAATAILLAAAVQDGDSEGWFAVTLWRDFADEWAGLPSANGRPIWAGLRYLYESDPAWTPLPEKMANPRAAITLPTIPVLDASYDGGISGTHLG